MAEASCNVQRPKVGDPTSTGTMSSESSVCGVGRGRGTCTLPGFRTRAPPGMEPGV